MNMQCEQFEQILEQRDTDALPKPALEHLETCEACRALSEDLYAIHDLAAELGSEEIAPPERLWVSLRNQLEAEGLIRESEEARPSLIVAKPGWWAAFQRPAIAGAFLALVIAGASTVGYLSNFAQNTADSRFVLEPAVSSVPAADSIFKEEVLTVGNDSIPGLPPGDGAVTSSLRRNLRLVDNFIAMCEKSVHEQPDNEMAREYLYGAYQQKAELLATATNRSMTGGLQ